MLAASARLVAVVAVPVRFPLKVVAVTMPVRLIPPAPEIVPVEGTVAP
jgi:hypothetical protein